MAAVFYILPMNLRFYLLLMDTCSLHGDGTCSVFLSHSSPNPRPPHSLSMWQMHWKQLKVEAFSQCKVESCPRCILKMHLPFTKINICLVAYRRACTLACTQIQHSQWFWLMSMYQNWLSWHIVSCEWSISHFIMLCIQVKSYISCGCT